jgi:hypothetical protein
MAWAYIAVGSILLLALLLIALIVCMVRSDCNRVEP